LFEGHSERPTTRRRREPKDLFAIRQKDSSTLAIKIASIKIAAIKIASLGMTYR